MPAASSSRRKAPSRRRNSEDIEMDRPTQDQVDNVESDGDAPRPSGKRGGKQASKNKSRAQEPEREGGSAQGEESDDERIDVSNFTDQPITKANAQFILGMANDWTTCDKVIRQHWSLLNDIGVALADAADGDEEPEVRYIQALAFKLDSLTSSQRRSQSSTKSCGNPSISVQSSRTTAKF